MTETEIKNMLKDIVCSNIEYEGKPNLTCDPDGCSCCRYKGYCGWRPYKLGEEIHLDWTYRKVEKWHVYKIGVGYKRFSSKSDEDPLFSGSKEECDKWIESQLTWMDKNYGEEDWVTDDIDANEIRVSAIEDFCKEFLKNIGKDSYLHVKTVIENMGVNIND